jgi:glycosyltransferase involved in cell wall biosynthesis
MKDNVVLLTEYLPDDTARVLLRSADVIVLPYRDTGESSSATLRFVLPLGRAVVVTDEPIFADSRDAVLVVDPEDPLGIESAVRRVLMDTELQRRLAALAARRAHGVRWDRAVAEHREIYTAARRSGRARRIRQWSSATLT